MHSQEDKRIKTKETSLFGRCNEEKVQIFVFRCVEEKSKVVRKTNTQVQRPEKSIEVLNEVFALHYLCL